MSEQLELQNTIVEDLVRKGISLGNGDIGRGVDLYLCGINDLFEELFGELCVIVGPREVIDTVSSWLNEISNNVDGCLDNITDVSDAFEFAVDAIVGLTNLEERMANGEW
jgi:hypothetical protein